MNLAVMNRVVVRTRYIVLVCAVLIPVLCCVIFFFQAEDGIRDLVRSRGLGDVYKRQKFKSSQAHHVYKRVLKAFESFFVNMRASKSSFESVSYTHLTLPTSDLV